MYVALSYFGGFYDQDAYEKWENHLEDFFQVFLLDTCTEMLLCPNEAGWRSLLVVGRRHINCRD